MNLGGTAEVLASVLLAYAKGQGLFCIMGKLSGLSQDTKSPPGGVALKSHGLNACHEQEYEKERKKSYETGNSL